MKKPIATMKRAIDNAWLTLCRAADKNSPDAARFLGEAFGECLKGERAHRAMGARFTHGQASYRLPAHYAAKAIIINHFCMGCESPKSWAEAARYRKDCALAYAVRGLLDESHPGLSVQLSWACNIDYAEDIAS